MSRLTENSLSTLQAKHFSKRKERENMTFIERTREALLKALLTLSEALDEESSITLESVYPENEFELGNLAPQDRVDIVVSSDVGELSIYGLEQSYVPYRVRVWN